MASVLLVDDHPSFLSFLEHGLIRRGYRPIIATSGAEALRRIEIDPPDVAVISGSLSATKIREVLAAGACGYVPKTFDPAMILAAVRLMLSGAIYVPPDVLAQGEELGAARDPRAPAGGANLTPRELEVLRMLSRGSANKEIARAIGVAEVTVKLHTRRILEKLGVRNRAAAAALAVSRRLIPDERVE